MLYSFLATYINWAKPLATLLSNHWCEAKVIPTIFTEEKQENCTDTSRKTYAVLFPHYFPMSLKKPTQECRRAAGAPDARRRHGRTRENWGSGPRLCTCSVGIWHIQFPSAELNLSLSPCAMKSSWCRSTQGMGEHCRSYLRGPAMAPGSKNHRRAAMGSGSHSPDFTSSYQLATDSKSSWPEVCEAGWHQLQASHTSSPNKMSYILQSPWQAGLHVGTACIGDDGVYNDANKRLT